MRIRRVHVRNFRNFQDADVSTGDNLVILGENGAGKSNFLYALRLVLDPSLSDAARQLRVEDFWDGIPRPLAAEAAIRISVELADFGDNDAQIASLAECLIEPDPMVAKVSFVFQRPPQSSGKDSDYEFFVHGGDNEDLRLSSEYRRRLPLDLIHALRDAESDLSNWRRSPLRPPLSRAIEAVPKADKDSVSTAVAAAMKLITELDPIKALQTIIASTVMEVAGEAQYTAVSLGVTPVESDRLFRSLRVLVDGGMRTMSETSLGLANVIYLVLKTLEIEALVEQDSRDHSFLAIEEPEAHLHPHLQRHVFKSLLAPRQHQADAEKTKPLDRTIILTTHSPSIASVSPVRSIVLLKRSVSTPLGNVLHTSATSVASAGLTDEEIRDLERYMDVTRADLLFARAALLVEGDAELFVVPTLARLLDIDLDSKGISVCSVLGTNFLPYVKLLGPHGLRVPFAVLTDKDAGDTGENRVVKLLTNIADSASTAGKSRSELLAMAPTRGLFLNSSTFELELLDSGRLGSMCKVLAELGTTDAAVARATSWKDSKNVNDRDRFLKDIEAIGKGRFAQRLATVLKKRSTGAQGPQYIVQALQWITASC